MKNKGFRQLLGSACVATLIGLGAAIPANAAHEMIYAVDVQNNLINFWSDAPANVINSYNLTGLQFAEEVRGIDFWNGTILALGSSSRLYTINPNTGAATQVGAGQFSTLLNGQTFATDNSPAGFQVVSGLGGGQNLLVDRTTAGVTVQPNVSYASGDPLFGVAPRIDGLAYDPATQRFYAADTLQNTLAMFSPASGVLNTIGMLGIDPSRFNGFDISGFTGISYLGTPAASSDPQANLYSVNTTTGAASLIGQIGQPGDNYLIRAMTVVPEPGSMALLGLGLAALLAARRRQ